MPTRIYALAKELNFDSKELVEVCKKAGISGKGSALASLSDDETQKLHDYLAGPKKAPSQSADESETNSATATSARRQAIRREDAIPGMASGKIKVIGQPESTASSDPKESVNPGEAATKRLAALARSFGLGSRILAD